jgi:hypothetical protein
MTQLVFWEGGGVTICRLLRPRFEGLISSQWEGGDGIYKAAN